MDAQLSSLETTLAALEALQRKTASSSRRKQPFTDGILNRHHLDVLDFIRDADPFEANLFWYPPSSGTGAAATSMAPSSSRIAASAAVSGALLEESAMSGRPSMAGPQIPEPRRFEPPTPLRRGMQPDARDGQAQQEFDTRTLLKAAQKLMDNYHNAPRARKHVKALLRRNAEVQKTIQNLDAGLDETNELIAKLSHPTQAKQFVANVKSRHAASSSKQSHARSAEEKRQLVAEIKREEMEIMAIEQTLEELQSRKQKKSSNESTKDANDRAEDIRPLVDEMSHDRLTEESDAPLPNQDAATMDVSKADETIRLTSSTAVQPNAQSGESPAPEIKDPPSDAAAQSEPDATSQQGIQTSDELERICENIWSIFGDHLRFVLPERDGADLQETIAALHTLSVGASSARDTDGSGDITMASSNASSQMTVATTGSTVSSASTLLPAAGPPTPVTMIAAHALTMLLTTPPPHTLDFDEIKRDSAKWWSSTGLPSLQHQQQSRKQGDGDAVAMARAIEALGTDIGNGDSLAVKAVYDLAAKKLLKLRFAGARRIVFFPANIV